MSITAGDGTGGALPARGANLRHQGISQLQQIGVGERGLNACNQIVTLFEDRYLHG
jgi:hypothetical protein